MLIYSFFYFDGCVWLTMVCMRQRFIIMTINRFAKSIIILASFGMIVSVLGLISSFYFKLLYLFIIID